MAIENSVVILVDNSNLGILGRVKGEGTLLCLIGCVATSLASTYEMLQTLPNVPRWGGEGGVGVESSPIREPLICQ